MKKAGWLKNAVATTNGYFTKTGKKLKGVSLTQEFVDQWNGVAEKVEAVVEEVVEVVETVVEAEEIVEEAPKPKKRRSKKTLASTFGLKD